MESKYRFTDPNTGVNYMLNADEVTDYILTKLIDTEMTAEEASQILYHMIIDGNLQSTHLREVEDDNKEQDYSFITLHFELKNVNNNKIVLIKDQNNNIIHLLTNQDEINNSFFNVENKPIENVVSELKFPLTTSTFPNFTTNTNKSKIVSKINEKYAGTEFLYKKDENNQKIIIETVKY